jgi:hypothetical protein
MPRIAGGSIALSLLVLTTLPGSAQQKMGAELQVNTYTTSNQTESSVALDAAGNFVVVWQSAGQDGGSDGIFARRFNATGSPLATELQVNTYTSGNQRAPVVSREGDGDFVVAWSSVNDGAAFGVFARRFNSAGVAQGPEFQVNTYTPGRQYGPAIAHTPGGGFVIAWRDAALDGGGYGVFLRRFDASGGALGVELQVNSSTESGQYNVAVGAADDGAFVVAWGSYPQDGSGFGIFARRFDAAGQAVAGEFQVNLWTVDHQDYPSVALDADGDFVIVWQSLFQDGYGHGVFGRRFDSAGNAQGGELQIAATGTASEYDAAVAAEDDGDFVVTWESHAAYDFHVFMRRFDSSGNAETGDIQVNTYTANSAARPQVSASGSRFVIAWQTLGEDGDGFGVFAQRFQRLAVLDIDGDGETAPLTDGLLVLRYLFGFTGATLVGGAVDQVNCTRCDAGAIASYLATLI